MKITKYFVVFGLCLLMGSCPVGPDTDIGDYENQLDMWNSQNMLDYKLSVDYYNRVNGDSKRAIINVKNGIPESSKPPEWLMSGEKSTISDFFSFIDEKNGYNIKAHYNTEYHYPKLIEGWRGEGIRKADPGPHWTWSIRLMPPVEDVQEAWNSQNMLDYQLSVSYTDVSDGSKKGARIYVKNGIPVISDPPEWLTNGELSTVPDFFSFIKEEEKRLEDVKDLYEGYFIVNYDPIYHYPDYIRTTDYIWSLDLNGGEWWFGSDIGDYENQLDAWNRQNMLDYKIRLEYRDFVNGGLGYSGYPKEIVIDIRNGIPVSSDPPEWITSGKMSTVPEIYSFIKEEAERIKNANILESLYVSRYDIDYHYPKHITLHITLAGHFGNVWNYFIELIPPVENEQEKWNRRNLLNYELVLRYTDIIGGSKKEAVVIVRNGVPESSDPPEWLNIGEMSTIPNFFSFIKEEEKRLEDVKASEDGFLIVQYAVSSPFIITSTRNYIWVVGLNEGR